MGQYLVSSFSLFRLAKANSKPANNKLRATLLVLLLSFCISPSSSAASLSKVSCGSSSFTGAATNSCSVYLSSAASSSVTVVLSSNNAAVAVPASVTVAAGKTTAGFQAAVASVTKSTTAAIIAKAGSVTASFPLQLNAPALQSAADFSAIYVDAAKGSDAASGTASAPLKTIQAAVTKANARNVKSEASTIIVNPGIYREQVGVYHVSGGTTASLTIQAASTGTAIVSGSNVLTSWTPESANASIFSSPWQYKFGSCAIPSGWPTNIQPIVRRTDLLFVNNVPLTQVIAASQLQPGTFYVDEPNSQLLAWPPSGVDMRTALVEASERASTLNISGRSNVTVRGLVFRHANSCLNKSGANISSSSNILVDQVQALWNNWGGLGVYSSSNVTVQNSIASYNGGVGFISSHDLSTLYNFNESDYNNWRGAQGAFYDWAMGGTKLFAMHGAQVRNHFSYNNQAQGLWFDTDNKDITIDNATLVGSANAALQIERNEGPITLQNSHLCSSGSGVNILTSEKVTIQNNAFHNNGATGKFQAQIFLAGQAGGINISDWQTGQLYNLVTTGLVLNSNSFQDAASGQYLFATYLGGNDWTTFANSLSAGKNAWYDPATPSAFKIVNGKLVTLATWQNTVGTDYTSGWTASPSTVASACAAPPSTYSDFHINLDSPSYSMSAGQAVATAHVYAYGSGTVNLKVTGLPSGVTANISQPSLVSGAARITLTAGSGAATQTVPITLWGVSSGRIHSVTFRVAVAR